MKLRRNPYLTSLAALVAFGTLQFVHATDYTWTQNSGVTQDWTTVGNWDANGVFATSSGNTLTFFSDITTALADGTNAITTNVPATLAQNSITLNGKGADATGATNITIGTNASTWTLDGTTPSVNLNGVNGTQALNYTVAANLTLAQATTAFTGNGTAGFTFSGLITGVGSAIAKSGTSTLTLSNTGNTFSGGLTINSNSGTVIANTINGTNKTGLGTGAVSIGSGSTLNLHSATTSASTAAINNTFTGTGLLKLTFTYDGGGASTTLSGLSGFNGTIQLANIGSNKDKLSGATAAGNAALIIDSGSQLYVNGTQTFGSINVIGTGNSENRGAIRLASALAGNITLAGSTTIGTEGGSIAGTITSGAVGTQTLTLGTSNSTGTGAFNGAIGGGTGTIALTNARGTSTLAGPNTYAGGTMVTGGTLNITGTNSGGGSYSVGAAGASATLTINSSGTVSASGLTLVNATSPSYVVNFNGGIFSVGSGGITASANVGSINFAGGTLKSSAAFNISSSIPIRFNSGTSVIDTTGGNITSASAFLVGTGTGSVTIQGGNTLTLPSGNSYNGATLITGSTTLKLGASTLPGAVTVHSGSKFDMANASQSIGGLAGIGTILNTGGATTVKTLTITGTGGNDFSGSINPSTATEKTNTGVIINLSSGAQTFSGTNTYTGITTISAGTLVLSGGNGTTAGTLASTAAGSVVVKNTTLQLQATASNTASGVSTALTGTGTANQILTGGSGAISSTIQLRGDNNVTFFAGSSSSGFMGGVNSTSGYTLNFDVNQLTAAGSNNVFTFGSTTHGLQIGRNVQLNVTGGNDDSLVLGPIRYVSTAGTLTLNPTSANLSVAGFTNNQTSGVTLKLDGTTSNNFMNGVIANSTGTGTPATVVNKTNSSTWTLSAANTYSGGTSIKSGSIIITGGNDRLLTTGSVTLGDVSTAGKLVLGDSTTARDQTLASLTTTGLGGSVVGAHASTLSVLTLNIASGTNTFGGSLGGTGNENQLALTKSGAGTLTLTGTNTYAGETEITNGTLAIGSGGSIANSSQIIVGASTTFDVSAVSFTVGASSAQTLSGTGQIEGNISIGGQGTLAISNSPGTMTFDGNLGLNTDSISTFEINGFTLGNHDLALAAIAGTQTVTFNGGTLNLLFQSGFNTQGTVKIFDFDAYAGSGFTTVAATGLASGFSASFDETNGIVTVIPEPRAALLGGIGLLALLRRRGHEPRICR